LTLKNWDQISSLWNTATKVNILTVWTGIFVYYFYQIKLWRSIFTHVWEKRSYLLICQIYFTSNLLAYIPGKVANFFGIAAIADRNNLSKTQVIHTAILFQIFALASASIVAVACLSITDLHLLGFSGKLLIPFLLTGIGIIFLLLNSKFYSLLNYTLTKLFKFNVDVKTVGFFSSVKFIFFYSVAWLINSLVFVYIFTVFDTSGLQGQFASGHGMLVNVALLFIVCYSVGLVTFFVPAGLGVADLGLIGGLSQITTLEASVLIVLSHRALTMLSSLVGYLIFCLFFQTKKITSV
jgi:hypothetical protein